MILVTVGTHYLGFDRLIKKIDEIAGKIDEEVIMQIGATKYKPKHAKYFDFKNLQEMQQLIRNARVVVCHGGAGSILDAIAQGKPIIAVPRLKKYNEILVDHQLDLVNTLAKEGRIIIVYDLEELEKALDTILVSSTTKIKKGQSLINFLRCYINELNNIEDS